VATERHTTHRSAVVLVGLYLMLQPFSTDLYVASLPGLTRTFGVDVATAQLTLSMFIAGFGVMQLAAGPLTDRFGRHPALLGGLGVYLAASVACALAPSMDALIGARFVQGLGCSTVVVVARAIVRDLYDPLAGARTMAQASTLLAFGAIGGPIVGAALEVRFGFRAAFVLLSCVAALLVFATVRRLRETHHARDRDALRPSRMLPRMRAVLRSREFVAYTIVGVGTYCGLFAFISGSSFVLIRVLGVPTSRFGLAFASCVVGYLLGTLACRRLLAAHGLAHALRAGAACAAIGGALLVALAHAGVHHWLAVVLPVFVFFFAHGVNFPCAQSGAIGPFPHNAGTAAGLFGVLVMAAAAATGALIGATHDGTVFPLAWTMAACAALVAIGVYALVIPLARGVASAAGASRVR
jgi:DHA1 family bicyclomycin/chloramphenicol resistance-like MFS transporter